MSRKFISMLLSIVLAATCFIGTASAAKEDPLILRSATKNGRTTCYSYLENGVPVITEEPGVGNYSRYYYFGRVLMQELHYENNICREMVNYDSYGSEIERIQYDRSGNATSTLCSEVVYDDFGRLINRRTWDPDNANNPVTNIRYEYDPDPTVFLGYYEQDGNLNNGPEPIEWMVLGMDGESLLLLSKYGLDSRTYHNRNASVNWKSSSIRSWLNGEFQSAAFAESPLPFTGDYYSSYFTLFTQPENSVSDRIFLLSQDEAEKYLPSKKDRLCTPTPYAIEHNAYTKYGSGTGWWMLRTPGKTDSQVVNINTDGSIYEKGASVSGKQGLIRPAMWVNRSLFYRCEETPRRQHENITAVDSVTGETLYLSSHLYTYDDAGRLTHDQDYTNGSMLSWEYDDHGNVTQYCQQDSHGYTESNSFHSYGYTGLLLQTFTQTTESTNSGKETTSTEQIYYTYDKAGRLVTKLWLKANGTAVNEQRTYDSHGNLLTVTVDGKTTETYKYVPISQALY